MRGIFKGLLAAVAVAALAGAPAKANTTIPLVDGGGWTTFNFLDAGSPFQDLDGNTIDFTFTLTSQNIVRITDGFNEGDQFDVTINGVDQGPTSTPEIGFAYVGDCWSCAYFFLPNQFSHASYLLGPGTYDIEGIAIQSVFGSGQGAIELGAVAVPEPASWAMMLLGFFGLGAMLRRSRRATAALA